MQNSCSVSREIVEEAVQEFLPDEWHVTWKEATNPLKDTFYEPGYGHIKGVACQRDHRIRCIYPDDVFKLAVFLHECAHAWYEHELVGYDDDTPLHEVEAELFAMGALRALGLSVPREYVRDARNYVEDCLDECEDIAEDEEVLKFLYGE